ncbi:MAG TPA: tetratricopeptide repeat protein [Burkholderiaceae bacterium]|nr:tetratricopeptide repeat protein [Burkholderiaceae bacterium]
MARVPRSAGIHTNLGNVLYETGRIADAAASYRTALEIEPESSQSWSNLATALHGEGNLAEARFAWDQALRLEPENADAWWGLSRTLIEPGQVNEGLIANSRAIALVPRHLLAREEVIRALVLLDRRADAERLYREWLAEDPDNPVATHQLAAVMQGDAPSRASDAYVQTVFDSYAPQFDSKLAGLGYQAPRLVADALAVQRAAAAADLDIADLGCGTGLCGPLLRPWARRLVGCDLSTGMLVRARQRQCYDALFKVELEYFLRHEPRNFDVLVSADTLCYFGSLDGVCSAAAGALRDEGCFIFTVEALAGDEAPWNLQTNGRYAHARSHLTDALRAAGFGTVGVEAAVLRQEAGLPVEGWVVTGELGRGDGDA